MTAKQQALDELREALGTLASYEESAPLAYRAMRALDEFLKPEPDPIGEALNSGDGSYKP